MKNWHVRLVSASFLILAVVTSADTVSADTVVEQPSRAVGYVIGDVLIQNIRLDSDHSAVVLDELPATERVDQWLERVSSKVIRKHNNQPWLELRYQIVNAPTKLITTSLPALTLSVVEGSTIHVDSRDFTVSPLSPASVGNSDALPAMMPNRMPTPPAIETPRRYLRYSLMALLVTLLVWSAWWLWRNSQDATRLPFSRAWRELRKIHSGQVENSPQAWFALHHAFNGFAGRTINSGSINQLIQQTTWLQPLQSRIEGFYAASATRFFEQADKPLPFALYEFGNALYLAEKQNSDGRQPSSSR